MSGFGEEKNDLLKLFPYLSFFLNSNANISFINVQKDGTKSIKDIIIDKVSNHLNFVTNGYATGFYDNRMEYLLFNLAMQSMNELDKGSHTSSGAHGKHITPFIYSDELEFKGKIKIAEELSFYFRKENEKKIVEGLKLRILLVDDKVGDSENCKANLIKRLLTLIFEKNLHDKVCWITPQENSSNDTITIELVEQLRFNYNREDCIKNLITKSHTNKSSIQIIAVKTISIARELLACSQLRFDLILMDYLLAEKPGDEKTREYATEFWGDGAEKYFDLPEDVAITTKYKTKGDQDKYITLEKQYHLIKLNRGPMNRLWIFPITAFNQTFIDDLRNKGVRLIDHYWYLSRGADPINTPYLFLYSLNNFLQLQLRQAIFSMSMLIGFVNRSLKQLKSIKNADDFQAFMGAEYTVMMQKFGWRPVIYRDKEAGSLFAAYVWDNFYTREKNRELFRLLDLVQKFYQSCAYGEPNDTRNMRSYLVELKVYLIDRQVEIDNVLNQEKNTLVNYGIKQLVIGLDEFREKINLIDK